MRWEDDRFNKWDQKWLDSIAADICLLHTHKAIFHEVRVLLTHTPLRGLCGNAFREFIHDAYVTLIVSDIHRQGKSDPSTLSLARLLDEISAAPTVLSRARFVALYTDKELGAAAWKATITTQFTGRGQEHVDPYLVKQDGEALKEEVRKVEAYAERYFGHRSQSRLQMEDILAHKELDESSEFLFALMQKYYVLFRATALTPLLLSSDWKDIFRDS
jgi:hypothetical protein